MNCMQYKKLQQKKAAQRKEDLKKKIDELRALGFDIYEPAYVYSIIDRELERSKDDKPEVKTEVAQAPRTIGF